MDRPDVGPPPTEHSPEGDRAAERADPTTPFGPAPPDADVRGPRLVCRLDERDHRRAGDSPPTLTLQPWVPRGAGATYVAWHVDDCGGHFGVLDAEAGHLYLGEGTPAGRAWRPVVEVGPAAARLTEAIPDLRPPVPTATGTTPSRPVHSPAPADATETGSTHAVELDSWTRPVDAYLQAWRPLNCGAAYVACRVDDPHERFSSHGWFGVLVDDTLRLGRRPTPAFVAVELGGETLAALAADVADLRPSPERTRPRVVDRVLAVHDPVETDEGSVGTGDDRPSDG